MAPFSVLRSRVELPFDIADRVLANSPELRELDRRIAEAEGIIQEAEQRRKRSIRVELLTPGLRELVDIRPSRVGRPLEFLGSVASAFVGAAVTRWVSGGDVSSSSVSIDELRFRLVELKERRAAVHSRILAEVVADQGRLELLWRSFVIARNLLEREAVRLALFRQQYRRRADPGLTEVYFNRLDAYDQRLADVAQKWGAVESLSNSLKIRGGLMSSSQQ